MRTTEDVLVGFPSLWVLVKAFVRLLLRRRRRSSSMNGEGANDTLLVNDQPPGPWSGLPGGPKALTVAQQAALMSNFAAHHQRMAQAAANMQAFGQIAHMNMQAASAAAAAASGSNGGDGMLGHAASGMYGKAPGIGQFHGVHDAGNTT